MRCLGCGYTLERLTAARCPECGRGFDPTDSSSWAARRSWRRLLTEHWEGLAAIACLVGFCFAAGVRDPMWLALWRPVLFAFWIGFAVSAVRHRSWLQRLPGLLSLLGLLSPWTLTTFDAWQFLICRTLEMEVGHRIFLELREVIW